LLPPKGASYLKKKSGANTTMTYRPPQNSTLALAAALVHKNDKSLDMGYYSHKKSTEKDFLAENEGEKLKTK
jgi:hypothetical protein